MLICRHAVTAEMWLVFSIGLSFLSLAVMEAYVVLINIFCLLSNRGNHLIPALQPVVLDFCSGEILLAKL